MEKLDINDYLRYGFSGAIFFFSLFLYKEPIDFIKTQRLNHLPDTLIVLGGVFALGSLLHILHRVIPHRIFYWIILRFVYERPVPRIIDLDLDRWRRMRDLASLQTDFREWGSQIFFLYSAMWSFILSRLVGRFYTWSPLDMSCYIWIIAVVLLMSSVVQHYLFLRYEREEFYRN